LHFGNYQNAIDEIITHSRIGKDVGDTGTNAAVAGALLGAYYGINAMTSDARISKSVDIMLSADTKLGGSPRPSKYEMSSATMVRLMEVYVELNPLSVGEPGSGSGSVSVREKCEEWRVIAGRLLPHPSAMSGCW
jgi:hypothetical protein